MFFNEFENNMMFNKNKTYKLYENLGLDKNSNDSQIKKAYRKLAMTHHPDRGGDENKFKEISQAYEILSNSSKREQYDQLGDSYLEGNGDTMGGNPFDIFNMFTGNSRNTREQEKVTKSIIHEYPIDLVDLYTGKQCKIRIKRENYKVKNGKNIKDCIKVCPKCNGSGICIQVRKIGPMIQQMQTTCQKCGGKGKIYTNDIKVFNEDKEINFTIERGMKDKDKITIYQESHHKPEYISGDVIVVLKQRRNKFFHREKNNLRMNMSIKLVEALCGFQKVLTSLDNRKLLVQSNSVIKEDMQMYIQNEGMPIKNCPQEKGDLVINFSVEYPTHLTREQKKILMENFYLPEFIKNTGEYEFVKMKKYTNDMKDTCYDSDDNSDDMSEKPVECVQQ